MWTSVFSSLIMVSYSIVFQIPSHNGKKIDMLCLPGMRGHHDILTVTSACLNTGTLRKILGICHYGGKKLKMLIISFHSC